MKTRRYIRQNGFTFFELLLVTFVIGILAAVAVPAYNDYLIRSQVAEGLRLSDPVKKNIAAYYSWHGKFPADNTTAALPLPEYLQGAYVKSIAVEQGMVKIIYGNKAHAFIAEKSLTLIPLQPDNPLSMVSWLCNGKKSQLEPKYLPYSCRKQL